MSDLNGFEPIPLDDIELLKPIDELSDSSSSSIEIPASGPGPTAKSPRPKLDKRAIADSKSLRMATSLPGREVHPLPGSGVARPNRTLIERYTSIDWTWVEELRIMAADQLSHQVGGAVDSESGLSALANNEEARHRATRLVADLVEEGIKNRLRQGTLSQTQINQTEIEQAVLDSLFGMGRLQPLLDHPDLENIDFLAYNRLVLEFSDGRLEDGPQIFSSDEEMRSYISFIASRAGRAFSPARPNLDLKLQGGERLSATSWVSAHTYMTIRKHRLTDITLGDLVERQECTELAAGFMEAMVKAKKSVVVAGQQGAGKTTAVRALCHAFDPDESIATFETEIELGLHEMPRFRRVKAFEARPGSGERGIDGRQAGEITLDDLLYNSFRMNLDRQIVGEVRGREVLAMIKAMQSGPGSLCTTHSADAIGAVRKLITCALEAGPHVTLDYATRAVADGINMVVYISRADVLIDGVLTRLRYISEIIEVAPGGDADEGFTCTPIFTVTPDSPYVAVPQNSSRFEKELDPQVFNRTEFHQWLDMMGDNR